MTGICEGWRPPQEALFELQLAQTARANVCVVGRGATDMLLSFLQLETAGEPITRWKAGQPFDLPSPAHITTLFVQDADALSAGDQLKLLHWLDRSAGRVRVLTTATRPLWPRVLAGSFNEVLYYRLNTVYLDIGAPPTE